MANITISLFHFIPCIFFYKPTWLNHWTQLTSFITTNIIFLHFASFKLLSLFHPARNVNPAWAQHRFYLQHPRTARTTSLRHSFCPSIHIPIGPQNSSPDKKSPRKLLASISVQFLWIFSFLHITFKSM